MLADVADRLRRRHRLRVDLDPPPIEPVPVRVVADGKEVRARRWIGSRLPRPVSAARARQLLRDELDEGDFWVEAVIEPDVDGELWGIESVDVSAGGSVWAAGWDYTDPNHRGVVLRRDATGAEWTESATGLSRSFHEFASVYLPEFAHDWSPAAR